LGSVAPAAALAVRLVEAEAWVVQGGISISWWSL
jgi:hypothetical protein